jgi:hypothetical protein
MAALAAARPFSGYSYIVKRRATMEFQRVGFSNVGKCGVCAYFRRPSLSIKSL